MYSHFIVFLPPSRNRLSVLSICIFILLYIKFASFSLHNPTCPLPKSAAIFHQRVYSLIFADSCRAVSFIVEGVSARLWWTSAGFLLSLSWASSPLLQQNCAQTRLARPSLSALRPLLSPLTAKNRPLVRFYRQKLTIQKSRPDGRLNAAFVWMN